MNIKTKKSSKNTTAIVILLLVAIVAAGLFVYALYGRTNSDSSDSQNSTKQQSDNKDSSTYDSNSESDNELGSDIPTEQLPESVDPSTDIHEHKLITENEKFKIRKSGDHYTITLYAIINNPSQYEAYREQLVQYKKEALSYMNEQGINTTKVKIVYEPEEATTL